MAAPAPTPLTPTKRYISAGTRRYVFVPTIATPSAPTSAEITAGTDLTKEIMADGVTGFSTTGDDVEVPDYGSRITGKIPGMVSLDDSSLRLYASSDSADARTLFADGTTGFIVVAPEGFSGTKLNVFTVRVKNTNLENGAAADPGGILVGYSVSAVNKNVPVPS